MPNYKGHILLNLTLFFILVASVMSVPHNIQAQTPADRALLVQQELTDLAAAGVDGALYWMYSGSRDQEFAFGSDTYSFFKGDPICDVLKSNVGNFSYLGVNIPSIGTANQRIPGAAEDAITYLSSTCGINMIRIFGFPDRGGVTATTGIVNLAHASGMQVIVALCDYANGCGDLGITGSTQINPTSWYTTGYQQSYGGPNYSGSYLDYANEMAQALAGNPGLYAIELLNEPHCGGVVGCIPAYSNWAQTVTSAIKSHGVSKVGIGQMASQPTTRGDSPGAGTPPDFVVSNSGSSINVASAHYYNVAEKGSALLANTQAKSSALSNIQEFYIGEFGIGEVPSVDNACVYWPWTPFCDNVSTPQLYCACSGNSCEPFESVGFVSPNDVDVGQDDGTGKGLFKVFDRDTETFIDIPPVLFTTSPGANACGTAAPPPDPGGGGGGGSGGGTCNPFNCFGAGVVDFATSLECAANALKGHLDEPTWFWFDRYGPYCHNETLSLPVGTPVADGGTPHILPFGYNYWSFFDTYLTPGSPDGRTCAEQPPSKAEFQANATHYPDDIGMPCPAQGDPIREPGHPAFEYFRGPLDRCPLPTNNTLYAAGSFGMNPPELAVYLVSTLNVTYQTHPLSQANPAELLQLLEIAQLKNINPFILLGIWATESWFGLNGGCSGGGGSTSCGPPSISPTSCMVQSPFLIEGSYTGGTEVIPNVGSAGHGSNEYWSAVAPAINECSINIPTQWMTTLIQDTGSRAPTSGWDTGEPNVCRVTHHLQPETDYFGLASDYRDNSDCTTLYMPTLDGITNWQKSRSIAYDLGDAIIVTGTNGSIVYKILYLHLGTIKPGTSYLAGQSFGEMWNWGGNTHVHVEMLKSTDGGATFNFVPPESVLCQ